MRAQPADFAGGLVLIWRRWNMEFAGRNRRV
jgi:hypothetical protein